MGDVLPPRPLPLPLHGARIERPHGGYAGAEGDLPGQAGAQQFAPNETPVGGDGIDMVLDSSIGGAPVPGAELGDPQEVRSADGSRAKGTPLSAPFSRQRPRTSTSGGALATEGGTAAEAEGRLVRQMKTKTCTSPTTSASALHAIQGRLLAPGPESKRKSQHEASCEGEDPTAALRSDCTIRGRVHAPGAAHEDQGIGTRGSGARGRSSAIGEAACAASGGDEAPAKRRRGDKEDVPRDQHRRSQDATSQAADASASPCWSSRTALLASLRSRGRPPERPLS